MTHRAPIGIAKPLMSNRLALETADRNRAAALKKMMSAAHDGQSTAKASGGSGRGGNPNHDPKTGQFASK